MSDEADLRVSDEERNRAAREIREHFAAGRLTQEEVEDRSAAIYSAGSQGELRAVTRDLPPVPPSPHEQRAELDRRRRHVRRQLLQQAGGGIVTFVVCTLIWVASGASGSFWPAWIAVVVAISLLRNGWRLYGPAPELDRVEESLAARRRSGRRS